MMTAKKPQMPYLVQKLARENRRTEQVMDKFLVAHGMTPEPLVREVPEESESSTESKRPRRKPSERKMRGLLLTLRLFQRQSQSS